MIQLESFPGTKDFSSFSKRGLIKDTRSAIGFAISTLWFRSCLLDAWLNESAIFRRSSTPADDFESKKGIYETFGSSVIKWIRGPGDRTLILIASKFEQMLKSLHINRLGEINCFPQPSVTIEIRNPLYDLKSVAVYNLYLFPEMKKQLMMKRITIFHILTFQLALVLEGRTTQFHKHLERRCMFQTKESLRMNYVRALLESHHDRCEISSSDAIVQLWLWQDSSFLSIFR